MPQPDNLLPVTNPTGKTVSVKPGHHKIIFKDVDGFKTPQTVYVFVQPGTKQVINATYIPADMGQYAVQFVMEDQMSLHGSIEVPGFTVNDKHDVYKSANTNGNLWVSEYAPLKVSVENTLHFTDVYGFATPADLTNITISDGAKVLREDPIIYERLQGSITVRMIDENDNPVPNAQWKIADSRITEWNSGNTTIEMPVDKFNLQYREYNASLNTVVSSDDSDYIPPSVTRIPVVMSQTGETVVTVRYESKSSYNATVTVSVNGPDGAGWTLNINNRSIGPKVSGESVAVYLGKDTTQSSVGTVVFSDVANYDKPSNIENIIIHPKDVKELASLVDYKPYIGKLVLDAPPVKYNDGTSLKVCIAKVTGTTVEITDASGNRSNVTLGFDTYLPFGDYTITGYNVGNKVYETPNPTNPTITINVQPIGSETTPSNVRVGWTAQHVQIADYIYPSEAIDVEIKESENVSVGSALDNVTVGFNHSDTNMNMTFGKNFDEKVLVGTWNYANTISNIPEGYKLYSVTESVNVLPNQTSKITVNIDSPETLKDVVTIHVTDNVGETVPGAYVTIDNDSTHYTNGAVVKLAPGQHTFHAVEISNYLSPSDYTYTAVERGRNHSVNCIYVENVAHVYVTSSDRPNAKFLVDNDPTEHPVGDTPVKLGIGAHTITYLADGNYRPDKVSDTVNLERGDVRTLSITYTGYGKAKATLKDSVTNADVTGTIVLKNQTTNVVVATITANNNTVVDIPEGTYNVDVINIDSNYNAPSVSSITINAESTTLIISRVATYKYGSVKVRLLGDATTEGVYNDVLSGSASLWQNNAKVMDITPNNNSFTNVPTGTYIVKATVSTSGYSEVQNGQVTVTPHSEDVVNMHATYVCATVKATLKGNYQENQENYSRDLEGTVSIYNSNDELVGTITPNNNSSTIVLTPGTYRATASVTTADYNLTEASQTFTVSSRETKTLAFTARFYSETPEVSAGVLNVQIRSNYGSELAPFTTTAGTVYYDGFYVLTDPMAHGTNRIWKHTDSDATIRARTVNGSVRWIWTSLTSEEDITNSLNNSDMSTLYASATNQNGAYATNPFDDGIVWQEKMAGEYRVTRCEAVEWLEDLTITFTSNNEVARQQLVTLFDTTNDREMDLPNVTLTSYPDSNKRWEGGEGGVSARRNYIIDYDESNNCWSMHIEYDMETVAEYVSAESYNEAHTPIDVMTWNFVSGTNIGTPSVTWTPKVFGAITRNNNAVSKGDKYRLFHLSDYLKEANTAITHREKWNAFYEGPDQVPLIWSEAKWNESESKWTIGIVQGMIPDYREADGGDPEFQITSGAKFVSDNAPESIFDVTGWTLSPANATAGNLTFTFKPIVRN